ncbi:MAG: DNA adenine methylase [Clostridiales bacterium]|jgi:DNA adenine methylase|nr:DNA adenine methylase [Clostridiales bacterium]
MNGKVPHIVQYQGSKRLLAPQILSYMPKRFNRLIEPFAGMAAITIAVAQERRADCYCINDINAPLVKMLRAAVETPAELTESYCALWCEQFEYPEGHVQHYYHVRDMFNSGDQSAANTLYLLARCVKGAVRYGKNGLFNQSPDKRRHGSKPDNVKENVCIISGLLKGKAAFFANDYHEILEMARPGDLVYMDPPYQGVSNARDNRYLSGLEFSEFASSLELLNKRGIDYLVSYDGECGGRSYGEELPDGLHCKKLLLDAGRSTQSTLLGKKETTLEALYVSEKLCPNIKPAAIQLSLLERAI